MRKKIIKEKNKSGKCPCEICSVVTFLEIHHINGREIDNYNHKDNLTNICPNCHNEIHHGKIIIEGWFNTTKGRDLIWRRDKEEKITDEESKPYIIP